MTNEASQHRPLAQLLSRRWSIFTLLAGVTLILIGIVFYTFNSVFERACHELETTLVRDRQAGVTYLANTLNDEMALVRNQSSSMLMTKNVVQLTVSASEKASIAVSDYSRHVIEDLAARAAQSELIESMHIFFPRTGYHITNINAFTADQATSEQMTGIVAAYPDGFYRSGTAVGFWSVWPYQYEPYQYQSTRLGFVSISQYRLTRFLDKCREDFPDSELLILWDKDIIAQTADVSWIERSDADAADDAILHLQHDNQKYYLFSKSIQACDLKVCILLPMDVAMAGMNSTRSAMDSMKYICVLALVMLSACLYATILRPIIRIRTAMRGVSEGDLSIRVPDTRIYEFRTVGIQFNRMIESLTQYIKREYEYKLLIKEAEMKQLQYQISPHFLYNTYYQMRNLLRAEEYDTCIQLSGMLGEYLRYIVHAEHGEALLKDEIRHAKIYADIQQLRFGSRIRVDMEPCDEALGMLRVPFLILQPLMENAFGHGMKDVLADGVIHFGISLQGRTLNLFVEDNGSGLCDEELEKLQQAIAREDQEHAGGIALMNIARRIKTAYDARGWVTVSRSAMGGLRTDINMNLTEEEMPCGSAAHRG